jgi:type II secretory pathway pseudopilin PulG
MARERAAPLSPRPSDADTGGCHAKEGAQACSLGSQAGLTLVELLVAIVVLIVVLLSTAFARRASP